jgi:hypothetical protein
MADEIATGRIQRLSTTPKPPSGTGKYGPATLPNSNLINAKTTVPQLLGEIPSGETSLVTAILALSNPKAGQVAWNQLPQVPRLSDLEEIIRTKGSEVSTMKLKDWLP